MKTISILFSVLIFAVNLDGQCPIPTPPPSFTVTVVSPYSVAFQTFPAQAPTTGYYAQREPEGGTFMMVNNGYPRGGFLDDIMLLPNHTFCYRTRAMTSCGTFSSYTDEVMITMPDGPMPYQGAPEAPSQLGATIYNSKVLLQWTLGVFPGVPGQTQTLQLSKSSNGGVNWSNLNTVPNNRTSYLDTSVVSGNVYLYRVRSFNSFGWATGYYANCGVNRVDCGTAWSNVASISIL